MKKDRRDFVVDKKKTKSGKKPNKKVIVIAVSCTAAVLCLVTIALCLYFFVFKKEDELLRSYSSVREFTHAECTLILSENVSVGKYDVANDVFFTESSYKDGGTNDGVVLYGLASSNKEYVTPRFSSIISVKGDYAIVTISDEKKTSWLGLIKFRGEGAEEKYRAISDFKIEYNVSNPEQFYFCGEYICVMGDKETPSSQANYSTFYDYKKENQLLECFRIRYGYDSTSGENYKCLSYDDYLVAYNNSAAYFFDIKNDCFDGYLELSGKGSSYRSPYKDNTVKFSVLYLGNGWFVRYASQTSSTVFEGYRFCYQAMDIDGNSSLVFARTSTDFYNVKTGVVKTVPKIYAILEVANKYTYSDFASTANSYNNNSLASADYPCLNPTDLIKDDYSILYFFYQPFLDRTDLSDVERSLAKETYCILDKNVNVILPDTFFPVVTVDGVGFETTDPAFELVFGDAVIYTGVGQKTVWKADSKHGYAVVGAHDGCATVVSLDLEVPQTGDNEKTGLTYGAITGEGKIIVDCVYDKISAFYGEYAVGVKIEGETANYYRIDRKGNETLMTDLFILKEGVYVFTTEEDKYGLKNYNGDVLIEDKYDSIAVVENYLIDGVYQKSVAIASMGKKTYIFRLE